jgi:hypothetical protein
VPVSRWWQARGGPSPLREREEGAKAKILRFAGIAGLRTVYLLFTKDLLVELRNRETFTVMLFFAVVILCSTLA